MLIRIRPPTVRSLDLGLLPKTSPIYNAIPLLQIRLKSTISSQGSDSKTKSTNANCSHVQTSASENKVPPLASVYTTGLSRLREHYSTTLQEDIMIASYKHHHKKKKTIPEGVKVELKGNRHLKPAPRPSSPTEVPELMKIDIHCMMKEAITSKYNLLSGVMAIQSITGETPEVIFAKKGVHNWKLRKGRCSSVLAASGGYKTDSPLILMYSAPSLVGMPIGCRVTLKGDKMYQFLDKLVEVVLPAEQFQRAAAQVAG